MKKTKPKKKPIPTKLTFTFRAETQKQEQVVGVIVGEMLAVVLRGLEKLRPGSARRLVDSMSEQLKKQPKSKSRVAVLEGKVEA